jgi:hypothetical protein
LLPIDLPERAGAPTCVEFFALLRIPMGMLVFAALVTQVTAGSPARLVQAGMAGCFCVGPA